MKNTGNGLVNRKRAFFALVTGITFLVGIGLVILRYRQKRESPIELVTTEKNGGKRCLAANYSGVAASETYNSACYDLQQQLTKAVTDGNREGVREALRYGANPNGSIDNFDPPLRIAARVGNVDLVELLLDNGADVNQGTVLRGTPLTVAAVNGQARIIEILLVRGANPCFKTVEGTAADLAEKNEHDKIRKLIKAAQLTDCR